MGTLEFEVEWSENPVGDLINYIREGYGVAFLSVKDDTTTQHFFFHRCQRTVLKEKDMKIIYLKFKDAQDPLIKNWSAFLLKSRIKECHCEAELFSGNSVIETGYCHVNVAEIVPTTDFSAISTPLSTTISSPSTPFSTTSSTNSSTSSRPSAFTFSPLSSTNSSTSSTFSFTVSSA